jgi:hypothetical protein
MAFLTFNRLWSHKHSSLLFADIGNEEVKVEDSMHQGDNIFFFVTDNEPKCLSLSSFIFAYKILAYLASTVKHFHVP